MENFLFRPKGSHQEKEIFRLLDRKSHERTVFQEVKKMDNKDSFLKTIEISESIRSLSGYRGPLRTNSWRATSQIAEISRTETFYLLTSNVRLHKFLEFMKLKHFLEGLTEAELMALYDAPGVLCDQLFTNALRAKNSLLSERSFEKQRWHILQERVQFLRSKLGLSPWNLNLLHAYSGNLRYELVLVEKRIRKVKKYSGYVKTPSAVGSKRRSQNSFEDLGTETTDPVLYKERDLVPFLLSPKEDYSLLGFSAENPIYPTLMKSLRRHEEFPEIIKHFILNKPIDPSVGNWWF